MSPAPTPPSVPHHEVGEVHVYVTPESLPAVVLSVRSAIAQLVDGRAVDIMVDDLHQPPRPADPSATQERLS